MLKIRSHKDVEKDWTEIFMKIGQKKGRNSSHPSGYDNSLLSNKKIEIQPLRLTVYLGWKTQNESA